MSRFSKRMWVIGIWAGLGVLVGMQFANPNPSESTTPKPSIVANTSSTQEFTLPVPQINPNPSVAGSYTITFQPVTIDTQPNEASVQGGATVPAYADKTPQEILIPDRSKSSVDVLADKTATLLQKGSQEGIRFVVTLFSSITE
ncbi:hypothetical protein ACP8HI_14290 [Paenibacillus sp. FA6]|uniref:hypothetical protein n=1 Tax=Paenibacillus sp. FA6 TaxID=3413029 RepID=UPI003F65F55A